MACVESKCVQIMTDGPPLQPGKLKVAELNNSFEY